MRTTHQKPQPHRAENGKNLHQVEPVMIDPGAPIQRFGTVRDLPVSLPVEARKQSVDLLNEIVADTITLRDLYKKCHWQVLGHTFYQLHLLFDKHFNEQSHLVDSLAERVQMLGGISIAMGADAAELTRIPRPPKDRESVPAQIARLLRAHEIVIRGVREAIRATEKNNDSGTNDLLMSEVLRTNEMQVWFLSEHLIEEPVVPHEEQVEEHSFA